MMDYEVFKNVVVTRIREFLPPLYESFEHHIHQVPKINGNKEALILDMEMADKRLSAPNIYLDDLYEEFKASGDLDKVLENAAMMIVSFTGTQNLGSAAVNMAEYKKDIVKALVNTAGNQELLAAAPHREFLDLSVIYRFAVEEKDGGGYATALITKDLQEELSLSDEELERLAEENTERKLKTKIMKLSDDVMVVTMEQVIYGAVNIMRNEILKNLAEHMNDDLHIIAASMHELVVIRSGCEQLSEIIASLKKDKEYISIDEEFLSDSIYFYSRKTEAVSVIAE